MEGYKPSEGFRDEISDRKGKEGKRDQIKEKNPENDDDLLCCLINAVYINAVYVTR